MISFAIGVIALVMWRMFYRPKWGGNAVFKRCPRIGPSGGAFEQFYVTPIVGFS
ncbi:hypothetical protein [Flavobacterium sp. J372]|uniref:hypothetical protein n=1 Tax=Flavobacterium sp. J372 TaxID=2898436 RepID=UPI0035B50212